MIIDYKNYSESELMKIVYGEIEDQQFVEDSEIYGMINKKHNFTGKELVEAVKLSIGVGKGSGSLPESSKNRFEQYVMQTKKLYARMKVDRESLYASKDKLGAFASFMTQYKKDVETSFSIMAERQVIANDINGSGLLAFGSGATANVIGNGTSLTPYVVQLAANSNMFNVEVGDLINIVTSATTSPAAETAALEVVAINPDTKTITLEGPASTRLNALVSGTAGFSATDAIVLQNSLNEEIPGLLGVLKATTGSYLGLNIQYRWKAHQVNASGSADRTKLINQLLTKMSTELGKNKEPKVIVASPTQYQLYVSSLENAKVYQFGPNESKFKASVSYSGVQVLCGNKVIPIISNRFVPEDTIMFLNTDHITWHDRHAPKWLDDDGTILLRINNEDAYEARYGCYANLVVNPHFQGIIYGLSTSA